FTASAVFGGLFGPLKILLDMSDAPFKSLSSFFKPSTQFLNELVEFTLVDLGAKKVLKPGGALKLFRVELVEFPADARANLGVSRRLGRMVARAPAELAPAERLGV